MCKLKVPFRGPYYERILLTSYCLGDRIWCPVIIFVNPDVGQGEYIQRSNTLIAMCCPFDDDLENQKVRAMAKEFDPDGQRTVGILTKADKIPEGLEGERMQLLSEPTEDYFLQHGYYAVKNPAQNELQEGMTHEQARKSEHNFFDGLKWQGVRRRCGTSNLRDFLSEQLSHLILQEPLAAFQHSSQE